MENNNGEQGIGEQININFIMEVREVIRPINE